MNVSCLVEANSSFLSPFRWTNDVQEDSFGLGNGYFCASVTLLYILLGTPWNSVVILVILFKRLWLSSPSVILLLNLVVSNFLVCVTVFPFIVVTGFSEEFLFGETDAVRCGFCWLGVLNITFPIVSLYALSLLAVDRLIYVKKPLAYSSIVTLKRALLANVIVWVLGIGVSIPPFLGLGTIGYSYVTSSCVPLVVGDSPLGPNFYYALLVAVVSSVAITTLLVAYVWIVLVTKKHLLRKAEYYVAACTACTVEEARRQMDKENLKKQFRMVQLFGAIFTANMITWIPMLCLAIAGAIVGLGHIPTAVYSVTYMAFLSEIVIHPILEVILIRDIRSNLVRCFPVNVRKRLCTEETRGAKSDVSHALENGLTNKSSLSVLN